MSSRSCVWTRCTETISDSLHTHTVCIQTAVLFNPSLFAHLSLLSVTFQFFSRYQDISILDFIGAKDDGSGGNNWSYKTCKAPVKCHHQQANIQFFTGRMPFLSSNQQRQCTEWKTSIAANFASIRNLTPWTLSRTSKRHVQNTSSLTYSNNCTFCRCSHFA